MHASLTHIYLFYFNSIFKHLLNLYSLQYVIKTNKISSTLNSRNMLLNEYVLKIKNKNTNQKMTAIVRIDNFSDPAIVGSLLSDVPPYITTTNTNCRSRFLRRLGTKHSFTTRVVSTLSLRLWFIVILYNGVNKIC